MEIQWPKHKCGMYISHNEYKNYYDTIEVAIEEIEVMDLQAGTKSEDVWPSSEERQKILDTGELWELRWYPSTPVGFCIVRASSFESLMKYAKEVEVSYYG